MTQHAKVKIMCTALHGAHLTATERHLPYGIT